MSVVVSECCVVVVRLFLFVYLLVLLNYVFISTTSFLVAIANSV